MYKTSLLSLLLITSIANGMTLSKHQVYIPSSLGEDTSLGYDNNQFMIKRAASVKTIEPWAVDKDLRGIDTSILSKLLAAGHYVSVSRCGEEGYRLVLKTRIKGGGLIGASLGAHIGVIGTNIIGHGILMGIAALSGPAAPAVYAGLAASYGPAILGASKAVGIGLGVATAVATGPV